MRTATLSRAPLRRPTRAPAASGMVRWIVLALVGATFAASGVVFAEPAPVDALTMGLMLLLPAVGMVRMTPLLVGYLFLWLMAGAAGFLASALAPEVALSTKYTAVSLYLTLASVTLAAFVVADPERHTEVILKGWLVAALVAAVAGLIGYFSLLPGAYDLFTRYGRAAGTFKDPNVFGTFLVPPILYALHMAIRRGAIWVVLSLVAAAVLSLGLLLSFSRGAWLNLALAGMIWSCLAFATARADAQRLRLVALGGAAAIVMGLVVAVAMQMEQVSGLLEQRASMDQSYDYGPDGRVGGQQKAIGLILENPLGIGAQVFVPKYHHEEVHNVYLSMMLNAGWLGGGVFLLLVLATIWLGVSRAMVLDAAQPLMLIALAAFIANALEGIIIDSDHWRHLYLEMALIWGIAAAGTVSGPRGQPVAARIRRNSRIIRSS